MYPNNESTSTVTLEELSRDPYPIFHRLRRTEPVSWIDQLGMWYVTRYEDVQTVLADPERFTTRFENSTVFDTFGAQTLTSDGAEQRRYRDQFRNAFSPAAIRASLEAAVHERAISLGLHLARLEARIALETLLTRLPGVEPAPGQAMVVEGYEFRQPRRLAVRWSA